VLFLVKFVSWLIKAFDYEDNYEGIPEVHHFNSICMYISLATCPLIAQHPSSEHFSKWQTMGIYKLASCPRIIVDGIL
jgi:hypothetical protein